MTDKPTQKEMDDLFVEETGFDPEDFPAALPEPLSKRPSEANTLVWVADPISSTGVRGVFVDDITCLWWWGAGLIFQKEADAAALALRMRSAITSHGQAPAETGNSVSAKGAAITSESGAPPAEQQATCTNSDSWNCKYCNKTKTCAALAHAG